MNERIEEIEGNLIGCSLRNDAMWSAACSSINENYFVNTKHAIIFKEILNFYKKKQSVRQNIHLFYQILEDRHIDTEYVKEMYHRSDVFMFERDLDCLISQYQGRKLEDILKEALKQIGRVDVSAIFERLIGKSLEVEAIKSKENLVHVSKLLSEPPTSVIKKIIDNFNKPGERLKSIVSTSFDSLDDFIEGFMPSNLIILAARPSMGKTALALNIALNVSENTPVGFISLEMSAEQLCYRLLSTLSSVPSVLISGGRISTAKELNDVLGAAEQLKSRKLYIEESSIMTLEALVIASRKMVHMHGVKLIMIDYMQLLALNRRSNTENRQQEISSISRSIKLLAKELNVCILCLSQLSRKVEDREDKTPKLSDLRESGSIEQDADQVLMLYRQDYYNLRNRQTSVSYPQLFIAKNRHGKVGHIQMHFNLKTLKFADCEDVYAKETPQEFLNGI